MRRLQRHLRREYLVENRSYPSQRYPIAKLADIAIEPIIEKHRQADAIHFVTHSLGGILVRHFFSRHQINNLGKTVMLGPPNGGSELVDVFRKLRFYRILNGPAGQELGTDANSVPISLGSVSFEVGVIAGNRSISPLYSMLIKGDDDGKVSVSRSRIEGMSDHIVMPVTHTFMMRNRAVISQIQHYLQHGKFDH